MQNMKDKAFRVTVTLPHKLAKLIDKERNDVSRSRFISRLLETALGEKL